MKLLAFLASLGFITLSGWLMLIGSGFFDTPEWWNVALLATVITLLHVSRYSFWGVLLPIAVLYAIYAPTGLTFGAPSYSYIASVFATDFHETKEFLSQIPLLHYMAGIAIVPLLLASYSLYRRFGLNFAKNPLFLTACSLLLLFFTPPARFLLEGGKAVWQVGQELNRLNNMEAGSEWGQSSLTSASRYDDYVLVIGESARKDYHHAYGYPLGNTPFLSHANGVLIDGLKAGGTNTIASLKLMLTKPNTQTWEGDYRHTLVDLVKSAGIQTYWLSNHGYLGSFDTPISSIANKSDEKTFLKAGDNDFKEDVSDFAVLPKFTELLKQNPTGKRFIVVHLYGSHPLACDRVKDYHTLLDPTQIEAKYHEVNCYVSSIKKTDEILERIHHSLQQQEQENDRRFSLIYFADHGLAHKINDDYIAIHNSSGKSKLHFDVPLFKTSSDDTERKVYRTLKSGLNFTDGIGNWIGIQNSKLNPAIDLFSPTPDPSDYGLQQMIDGFDVELDPAVVIPQKQGGSL